jgi:hypothetical protein
MSRKRGRLALALCIAGVSCVALFAGIYVIVYIYSAWRSERVETDDWQEDGVAHRSLKLGELHHARHYLKPSDPELWGKPDRDFSRLATTYYHRHGPAGRVMELMNWFPGPDNTYAADVRMPASLVGLGATPHSLPLAQLVGVWSEPPYAKVFLLDGCMASYARPYQWVDFYEHNSDVIALSLAAQGERPKFAYLTDAQQRGAHIRLLQGQERKSLAENGPKKFYHVLVADVGTDAIVKNLMTREATALYFEALTDDGILLVHTTNRYYDLSRVVADVAGSLGLVVAVARDNRPKLAKGQFVSEWMVVARRPERFAAVRARIPPERFIDLRPMQGQGRHIWVDGAWNAFPR